MTTDIELAELRYSGKPAAFLRGFRAVYLGVVMNCIILGWVNLAMVKILMLVLGVSKDQALWIVIGIIALTSFVSTLSGLWGVLVTDLFQFAHQDDDGDRARRRGGARRRRHRRHESEARAATGQRVPELRARSPFRLDAGRSRSSSTSPSTGGRPGIPGAEPGGGGYVAQRMFSAKDERNSLLATLWFNVAHYALRPWPWVLVGMASVILYPHLQDPETGYVRVMIDYLPASLRGLMVAAFAAAFMSTIGTQLNWGASYLVNDFYRRFVRSSGAGTPLRRRVAGRDGSAHHHLRRHHALHGFDRRRVEAADRHRRGHGHGADPALVLVAHQRVERSFGHGRGVRGFVRAADCLSISTATIRSSSRISS